VSVSGTPLLVVVGGPTGVGKSTLVNSLLGRAVSDVRVLRPTTRVPVLVHHPDDAQTSTSLRVPAPAHRVADDACPRGLVLVDSPDLDSVETDNRSVARAMLDVADVWLAVTSPARYADRTPWEELRRASRHGRATVVVLARVTAETSEVVVPHLATLLTEVGLGDAPVTTVPEQPGAGAVLPASAVAGVRSVLTALAEHAQARSLASSTQEVPR
jgi:GTPase SAR1 family protein